MKIIIFFLLIFFLIQCNGQYKKIPKPKTGRAMQSHDSLYSYWTYDTLRGSVSYKLSGGIVKGEGAIITERYWQCHKIVYDYPKEHDSLMALNYKKDSLNGYYSFSSNEGCSSIDGGINYHKNCYIKTKQGWRRVNEEYIFIPD